MNPAGRGGAPLRDARDPRCQKGEGRALGESLLLLGMLVAAGQRDRLSGTSTKGHKARNGQMVEEHLPLTHRSVWAGNRQGAQIQEISTKLLRHLFHTEGAMNPSDRSPNIQRDGGRPQHRRNPSRAHAGEAQAVDARPSAADDVCGSKTATPRERCLGDVKDHIQIRKDSGTPYDHISNRHMVALRGSHWVLMVCGSGNAADLSPQIFRSEAVAQARHNARAVPAAKDMLPRTDLALLSIPFAGQTWSPERHMG